MTKMIEGAKLDKGLYNTFTLCGYQLLCMVQAMLLAANSGTSTDIPAYAVCGRRK